MECTRVNIDCEMQNLIFHTFTHPLLYKYLYITPPHPTQKIDTAQSMQGDIIFNIFRKHTRAGTFKIQDQQCLFESILK